MIEINVPVERFEEFRKSVIAVAKKFKVTGRIEQNPETEIEKIFDPNYTTVCPTTGHSNRIGKMIEHPVYKCRVIIEDAEYKKFTDTGATFVGSIHKDDVVTVGASPEGRKLNISIASLKDEIEEMACASCGKKMRRKKLLVFLEADKIRTYGTSCAKTKFGVNFESLISRFNRIKDLLLGGVSDWSPDYTDANVWATLCMDTITKDGYISGRAAYEHGGTSTTNQTWAIYHAIHSTPSYKMSDAEIEERKRIIELISEADFDFKALESLGLIKDGDDSDFAHNMNAALELAVEYNSVSSRTAGFLCYAIFRLTKDIKAKAEKVEWNENHSYKVDDKIKNLEVTVNNVHEFGGRSFHYHDDGLRAIYTFRGVDGVRYKWFSDAGRLNKGDKVIITSATVKKLEDHVKFGKAVILNRCRVK